ncbi:hypothetical protein AAU61_10855 [Desulfocarbo indianensis]|nr:hypothetical protein AAU61_10855 [Desulfocarbo indianensis]
MRCVSSAVLVAAGFMLAFWLACGPGTSVQAAEEKAASTESAAEQEEKKSSTKLEDVLVRGKGEAFSGIEATSATVLDNADVTDRIYVTPLDMMKLSPGVNIVEFHQGGVPSGLQMRGFPWVSHYTDGAVYLDGVTQNTIPDGGSTNVVIPLEVERVEIIKGPSSVFYGNYASAGSLHFHTFQAGDFTRLKMQYGSFNTQDLAGVMARRDGNLDHVYSAQVYHTDGYQDNSKWDKQIGAGRWTYHCGDRLDANFGLRVFHSTWDAPGYIPQHMYNSNPSSAVSDVNGGWSDREEARANLLYKLTDTSNLKFSAWGAQQEFQRYYQGSLSAGLQPGTDYGSTWRWDREAFGTGLSYSFQGKVFSRETKFDLGVEWMYEEYDWKEWNLVVGRGRTAGDATSSRIDTRYCISLYGELDYQILTPLRLVLGSRFDSFQGTLENRLESKTIDRDGPDIYSPKAGLVFNPIKGVELFANYGKGFALPEPMDFYERQYLDPAIRTQYETGVRFEPNTWSRFSLTLWSMDTTDDFQPNPVNPNQVENAGETRRQGIEADAHFTLWKHLKLRLDYAYTDTEYLSYVGGDGQSYDGNELTYVPHNIFNAEIGWHQTQGWGGRLTYRYVTDYFIDSANTMKGDAYGTVSAQASYRFNKQYKLALDVINLFDREYADYVGSSNGEKIYSPGNPLSVYLTFTIDW